MERRQNGDKEEFWKDSRMLWVRLKSRAWDVACRSLKKGTDFRADGGGLCRDGRGWGGVMLGVRPGCPVDSGAVRAEAGVGAEGSGHCDLS